METFFNSVQSVTMILLLTAVGYFCAAKRWLGDGEKQFISKFLMNIAIPFMCVYGLRSRLTMEILREAGVMLLVPLIDISACFLLSYPVGKLLRLPHKTLGVFMMMCGLSNTLFIGYPMCTEIYGEAATPYIMVYYMVSSSFTQMVGLTLVRWAAGDAGGSFGQAVLRFFQSPTVIGILAGIALVVFDIQPPTLLMSFGKYMNQLVTPLALLITGEVIYSIGWKRIRIDKVMCTVAAFRFLIAPLLCVLLCGIFDIHGMARDVFVVQSAMPVVTQTVVAASEYGADEESAAQGAALTTLLSFVVVPLLTWLLA